MILILLLGILLIGIAVALVARALVLPRLRAAETVGQISSYGFEASPATQAAAAEQASPGVQLAMRNRVDTLATTIGGRLEGRLPGWNQAELRRRLLAAGLYTTSPTKFVGYQALATVLLPALYLWITLSGGTSDVLVVLGTILSCVLGWLLPMSILKRRGQRRMNQIDYDLPELIDALVTTVEAGIAFGASLQIASQRFHGPLADELRLMVQEQNMGLGVTDALAHMLERCDTPAMRSFVRSIIQGELLGVSVGQTLRDLAREMRKRRRAAAEERAHKAPVKILFPLVFLMFPAIFVILLGPALLRINDLFGP